MVAARLEYRNVDLHHVSPYYLVLEESFCSEHKSFAVVAAPATDEVAVAGASAVVDTEFAHPIQPL